MRAELHAHTNWSDGVLSVESLARAAIDRGYKMQAITDHSAYMGITGGLKAADMPRQHAEIEQRAVNAR